MTRKLKRRIKGVTKESKPENPEKVFMRCLLKTNANEAQMRLMMMLYLEPTTDGWTQPISIAEIQERIGKGRTAVTDGLKKFKLMNWLESEKRGLGSACRYKLIIPLK